MSRQPVVAAPPVNSFILPAVDGSELVLRSWLPTAAIRQVVLSISGAGTAERAEAIGQSCADLGVATFAVDVAASRPHRRRWAGRRSTWSAAAYGADLVSWLRMLYPGVPVWVLGADAMASLVADSPAEARRIVRQAAALT